MIYRETAERIRAIVVPFLEKEQMVLVELRFMKTGQGMLLRLLVDRQEGGINLEDCARLNNEIGSLLDTQDIIHDRYTLEISSPGLDRDLSTKEDFSRCINRQVRVFFNESIEDKTEIEGRIDKVDDQAVHIDTPTGVIAVPLVKIAKAKQKVEVV